MKSASISLLASHWPDRGSGSTPTGRRPGCRNSSTGTNGGTSARAPAWYTRRRTARTAWADDPFAPPIHFSCRALPASTHASGSSAAVSRCRISDRAGAVRRRRRLVRRQRARQRSHPDDRDALDRRRRHSGLLFFLQACGISLTYQIGTVTLQSSADKDRRGDSEDGCMRAACAA